MTVFDTISREEFLTLQAQVAELAESIAQIQDKSKAKGRKEFDYKIQLVIQKQDFVDSKPEERTDPFNNFELVFWASYLLRNTNRKEKVDTFAEVGKRAKRIKEVVKHFEQFIKTGDEKERNRGARNLVKDFLEYVLLGIPEYKKGNEMVPMTFWPAVSDWSINNNTAKMHEWKRDKRLSKFDIPVDDED